MGGVGEITRAETGMEVGLELDWKDEGPGRGLAGVALTAYGAGRVCFLAGRDRPSTRQTSEREIPPQTVRRSWESSSGSHERLLA